MISSTHTVQDTRTTHASQNKLRLNDRAAHDWYRFVLSYPPHLVRDYLDRFGLTNSTATVLDPFCGTGTTLVECKKLGIASVGIEANPMAAFASDVKIDWSVESQSLQNRCDEIAEKTLKRFKSDGLSEEMLEFFGIADSGDILLGAERVKLLLANSISPVPLRKSLHLLTEIDAAGKTAAHEGRHERLAFASALVNDISNLHFGPEVGVGKPKQDAPVISAWSERMNSTVADLRELQSLQNIPSKVYHADARNVGILLPAQSVDAIITSPPYPNEKDYTRTTRLESVILGFINTKEQLRELKKGLVRSNTRGVYVKDTDDEWVATHTEIQRIAAAIEARRIELGKTSGFERLYARVTRLYFGGMARHLEALKPVLKPGAQLAYVVGDQASYLRVMIRTGQLLADIAESLGYEVKSIDLFRTRRATATRSELREEVVVLRWPGAKR